MFLEQRHTIHILLNWTNPVAKYCLVPSLLILIQTKVIVLLFPLDIVIFDFGEDRDHRLYMHTSRDGLSGDTLVFYFGCQTIQLRYHRLSGLPTVISDEVWTTPLRCLLRILFVLLLVEISVQKTSLLS